MVLKFDVAADIGGPARTKGQKGFFLGAQAGLTCPDFRRHVPPHHQWQQTAFSIGIDIRDRVAQLQSECIHVGLLWMLA